MKKMALLMGSITLFGVGGAWATIECTPTPDCYDLGYDSDESDCDDDFLRCPFDADYVHCIQREDKCSGYTKVATNGKYTCADGQTVEKCADNKNKYRCNGTACAYGYYTYDNMPACPYDECCRARATSGNTNCYAWRNNVAHKSYTSDYAACRAMSAGYVCYGKKTRLYSNNSSSYIEDACGNPTYVAFEDTADCSYQREDQWHSYINSGYNGEGSTAQCFWSFGNSVYNGDCTFDDPDCYNPKSKQYCDEYGTCHNVTWATFCYNKYGMEINCGGYKYQYIDKIPEDVDRYERL